MNPGFGIPKYRVLVPGAGLLMFLLAGCFNSEMKWEQIGPAPGTPQPPFNDVTPVSTGVPIGGRVETGYRVVSGAGVNGLVAVSVSGGKVATGSNGSRGAIMVEARLK